MHPATEIQPVCGDAVAETVRRRRARGAAFKTRTAAAALEMALILPLLLTVLTGLVNIGWIYHIRQTMMFAAREGARELSLQGATLNDAVTLTQAYLTAANIQNATITGQNAFSGNGNGSIARKVFIQVQLPPSNAILSDPFNLFGSMSTLSIRVTMRKEGELLPP